jgi:pantothenate kinase type III
MIPIAKFDRNGLEEGLLSMDIHSKERHFFVVSVNPSVELEKVFAPYTANYTSINNELILKLYKEKGLDFPKELGVDRSLKCVYLCEKAYKEVVITVDFGTATVIECIYQNKWFGGTISPGVLLQLLSLNRGCKGLTGFSYEKVLKRDEDFYSLLHDTEGEIHIGVLYSTLALIKEFTKRMTHKLKEEKRENFRVILLITGGIAHHISDALCNNFFTDLDIETITRIDNLNLLALARLSELLLSEPT